MEYQTKFQYRYHTDEDFRKRVLTNAKMSYQNKYHNDPTFRQKMLAKAHKYYTDNREEILSKRPIKKKEKQSKPVTTVQENKTLNFL